MARPTKPRRICEIPRITEFSPTGAGPMKQTDMTVDEFETIRLIDYLGYSQEDCAVQMNVARTTVQAIYESARIKLATALVEGHCLQITGGAYELCPYRRQCCAGKGGHGRNCLRGESGTESTAGECRYGQAAYSSLKTAINSSATFTANKKASESGGTQMKVAVTYENGQIFQHFGHCQHFKIYTVTDQKIQSSQILDASGSGHGALAGFLKEHGTDALICGGIGAGARTALAEAGIRIYPGVAGDADESVSALLNNSLTYDPDTVCSHHHEEGHNCGEDKHGCGGH